MSVNLNKKELAACLSLLRGEGYYKLFDDNTKGEIHLMIQQCLKLRMSSMSAKPKHEASSRGSVHSDAAQKAASVVSDVAQEDDAA